MALKRAQAFGDGKLQPIRPDEGAEEAFVEAAEKASWHDRNPSQAAGDSDSDEVGQGADRPSDKPKAKASPATKKKAAAKPAEKPKTEAKPKTRRAPRKSKAAAKKPARPQPVSASFPELVSEYTEVLAGDGTLDLPPNPVYTSVERHRLYTMCPVHTAAALQAYSDARGLPQLWIAIDELLRIAEVYGEENAP